MSRSISRLAGVAPLALGALALLGAPADAHEPGHSGVRIEVTGTSALVTYTVAPADLLLLVGEVDRNGDGLLDRDEYARLLPELGRVLAGRLRLSVGDAACRPVVVSEVFPARRALPLDGGGGRVGAVLRYEASREVTQLRVESEVFPASEHARREVVEFVPGEVVVLEGDSRSADWSQPPSPPGPVAQALALVGEGVWHILIGWDHLAFLLGLLLVARGAASVVGLVTAFTIAHSITLALVALRLSTPPSALVEAVIALSIAYVGVENLLRRGKPAPGRWMLVLAFGLVHGMGFGGVLLELELTQPLPALIGFNIGVELGQLAVVLAVCPLLAVLRRRPGLYDAVALRGGSALLVVAGLAAFAARAV